jgi:DNA-binding GntR family transcriptional regulator
MPGRFERKSSGEHAASHIRHLIFDGELRGGTHVPQDDIARDLGMSRIPIREALISLERQGWVRIERHRGAFVAGLDPAAVHDHYELFGLIYGFAARRAIERDGTALAERLQSLVTQLPASDDEPARFGEIARTFHAEVVAAARSPRVDVALRSLSNLVPGEFFTLVPDSMAIERRLLRTIQAAVTSHDADGAAAAYAAMMRPIGELVVALFKERGLFEETVS